MISSPLAKTATVLPPASRALLWATVSMPLAKPADDGYLAPGEVGHYLFGNLLAVNSRPPRADHRQAPFILRQQRAFDINYRRVVINFFKALGISGIVYR